MSKSNWAEKQVEKVAVPAWGPGPYIHPAAAAMLLRAEHKRAVRAVRKVSAKQCPDEISMTNYDDGYIRACLDILAALRKGRNSGRMGR